MLRNGKTLRICMYQKGQVIHMAVGTSMSEAEQRHVYDEMERLTSNFQRIATFEPKC